MVFIYIHIMFSLDNEFTLTAHIKGYYYKNYYSYIINCVP